MADPQEGVPGTVALLGGGVIGGGWAARFVLNGVDVRVHDPDPEAGRKVGEVIENGRRAMRRLTHAPLPAEGRLELCGSLEDAVAGAGLVVESAPEREALKRELFARAERAAGDDTLFTSSTSGLRPSALQADMRRPERMLVAHPFNPVYLLPLVELCAGQATAPEAVERMRGICEAIGMAPLLVRREIDGFLADRLMEAMWRESLWLVNDGVATVTELDDAVRLGAGLRWAAMGTFETYRIAGGEEGMRHFMEQFGPALRWPWTRLTEVPELTDALLDRIAEQSDEQAAGMGFRDMERRRDDCLVGVIQALRAQGVGAGAVLERYERSLMRDAADGDEVDAGGRPVHRAEVLPEWVDYNGHAHESRYLQVFGDATDGLLRRLDVDGAYLAEGRSFYTVETHLSHLREISAAEELEVTTQVLDADGKRLHVFHEMHCGTEVVATAEQMLLHVDTEAGRTVEASGEVAARVQAMAAAHAELPRPRGAGRGIGMPSR